MVELAGLDSCVAPPSRSGGRAAPEPPQYGPRQHWAGNARLLAAPNRYLAAGSTAGSCLLESADDGTAFAKDYPDQVAGARAAVCDQVPGMGERSRMTPEKQVFLRSTLGAPASRSAALRCPHENQGDP